MGFFSSPNCYEVVQNSLCPKDGLLHVLLLDSFTSYPFQKWPDIEPERTYNSKINEVLVGMQKNGYEIVDVKFDANFDKGSMKEMWCVNTLIMYK